MSYSDQIKDMAAICRQDPVYLDSIRAALLESGLAAMCGLTVDESKLDPFGPCPTNWTAMQFGFFDNGEIPKGRNRPKIQRTKMRYSTNIMVWSRPDINFSKAAQVAWQANCYFWTAEEARQIVRDLQDEKYVGDETVALVDEWTANAAPHARFGIPLLKLKSGTKWMRNHLVMTSIKDDKPTAAVVIFPGGNEVMTMEPLVDYLANGGSLSGNCILAARLAREPSLGQWATEILK